jgi:hypothetical protein
MIKIRMNKGLVCRVGGFKFYNDRIVGIDGVYYSDTPLTNNADRFKTLSGLLYRQEFATCGIKIYDYDIKQDRKKNIDLFLYAVKHCIQRRTLKRLQDIETKKLIGEKNEF